MMGPQVVQETSLAGPGFINIRVQSQLLAKRVKDIVTGGLAQFAPDLKVGTL